MTSRPVTDLKYFRPVGHRSGDTRKETTHVHWQTDIYTSPRLHAPTHISTLRYPPSGKQQRQKFHLPRPISLHGLCSANISGESPRYRGMSSSTTTEAIPYGYSRHRGPIKSCRRQRAERLAYIFRPCSFIDHNRSNALQQRTIRCRFTANRICTGCNYDRSVFIDVPLGHFPSDQGRNKTAYSVGPEGQYPHVYQHFRWQSARCQHPRRASHRAGRLLHNGPWLSGLCQTSYYLAGSRVLCNPDKVQLQMPQNLFSSCRPLNWSPVRPNNYAYRVLFTQRLSRQATTCEILRRRNRENPGLSDQQFLPAGLDHCTTISLPLASGTLFQMDQAKPAHQEFLRHFGERSQNSNLDCRLSLRTGRHTQEATQYPSESLHNFTNSERLGFRKNITITVTYRSQHSTGNGRFRKPVEFIHLTVGRL